MSDVRADVASGDLKPIYLLFGQESWLVREAYDQLFAKSVSSGPRGFNEQVFEGDKAGADAIAGAARHLPMMGKYRTIVVRNVGKLNAEDQERLGAYCTSPSETTVLLLLGADRDRKVLDGRKKLAKAIKKNGRWCEFKKLYGRNLHHWIEGEARRLGKKLDPEGAGFLEAVMGNDLAQVANGLVHASLFVGEADRITLEDLEEVVSGSKQEALWDLLDCIGQRRLEPALRNLQLLFRQGEREMGILALTKKRVRLLLDSERAIARGVPPRDALSEAGVIPSLAWKFDRQLGRYEPRELQRGISRLLRAESDLKGGARIDSRWSLERAIVDLIRGR
jgi:DNA polymerase III subunit delta